MNSIRILDSELRSQIRSGFCVVSFAQCVQELCLNSLEAGANCIAVRISFNFGRIQVADNGAGIAEQDMPLVGERYATSKFDGHRGEFLASLRDVSGVLEITSRSKNDQNSSHKAYFRGKPKITSKSCDARPSPGTTVTAHDFMYNLPVRRKSLQPALEIPNVRRALIALALTRPEVSVSLRDDCGTDKGTVLLKISKAVNSSETFSRIFNIQPHLIKPVKASQGPYELSGFIAQVTLDRTESLLFLSVNKRPVHKTLLNKALRVLTWPSNSPKSSSPEARKRNSGKGHSCFQTAYVLDLKCLPCHVRLFQEPERSFLEFSDQDSVNGLVERLVAQTKGSTVPQGPNEVPGSSGEVCVLVGDIQHSLNSLPVRRRNETDEDSDDDTMKQPPVKMHLSSLQAFKSKYARDDSSSSSSTKTTKLSRPKRSQPPGPSVKPLLVKPCSRTSTFPKPKTPDLISSPKITVAQASHQMETEEVPSLNFVQIADPVTRETVYVDPVSGNSYFDVPQPEKDKFLDPAADTLPTVKLTRRPWASPNMKAGDITELYRTWDNPCFRSESVGDAVDPTLPDTRPSFVILKSDFDHVQVIGQVEQKFIAAFIDSNPDRKVMIAFDQHAVHERIRLEQLLDSCMDKDRGGPLVSALYPPLSIPMNKDLNRIAAAFPDHLKRWGVRASPDISSGSIRVHGLPACIVERAASESSRGRGVGSDIVTEHCKKLISELLQTIKSTGTVGSVMPKCLLEILKSQACHGAIKFGDALTLQECESLIGKLKKCKLPFQCAHGRPTVIPLLNFQDLNVFQRPPDDSLRTWKLARKMNAARLQDSSCLFNTTWNDNVT